MSFCYLRKRSIHLAGCYAAKLIGNKLVHFESYALHFRASAAYVDVTFGGVSHMLSNPRAAKVVHAFGGYPFHSKLAASSPA